MKKAESLCKGTEDMKKNQTGISELKQDSSVGVLTSRMEETKERISELEGRTKDTAASEEQGENRPKK